MFHRDYTPQDPSTAVGKLARVQQRSHESVFVKRLTRVRVERGPGRRYAGEAVRGSKVHGYVAKYTKASE